MVFLSLFWTTILGLGITYSLPQVKIFLPRSLFMRTSIRRETAETTIEISLDLEWSGLSKADTDIPLLDEIIRNLAKASRFDVSVKARGDLPTGDHHTVEDVAITLGSAIAELTKEGIGSSTVPSGTCLAQAVVRLGEPGYSDSFEFEADDLGGVQLENVTHFMRALAYNGNFTLHLKAVGGDDWQKVEALTLALGRALGRAARDD